MNRIRKSKSKSSSPSPNLGCSDLILKVTIFAPILRDERNQLLPSHWLLSHWKLFPPPWQFSYLLIKRKCNNAENRVQYLFIFFILHWSKLMWGNKRNCIKQSYKTCEMKESSNEMTSYDIIFCGKIFIKFRAKVKIWCYLNLW